MALITTTRKPLFIEVPSASEDEVTQPQDRNEYDQKLGELSIVLDTVDKLHNAEVLGKGPSTTSRRTIPVDMSEALEDDYPYWREERVMFLRGCAITFDRFGRRDGFHYQGRASVVGFVLTDEGLAVGMASYSLANPGNEFTRSAEALGIAESFKSLPLNQPVVVNTVGAVKKVHTNKGVVHYFHVTRIGDIDIPQYEDLGPKEPITPGHPCKMLPMVPLQVTGNWIYPMMSPANVNRIEARCRQAYREIMDAGSASMAAHGSSESALGEDLDSEIAY